jgi:hypothetical protein
MKSLILSILVMFFAITSKANQIVNIPEPINTLFGSALYEKTLADAKTELQREKINFGLIHILESKTPGGFKNFLVKMPVQSMTEVQGGIIEAQLQTIGMTTRLRAIRFLLTAGPVVPGPVIYDFPQPLNSLFGHYNFTSAVSKAKAYGKSENVNFGDADISSYVTPGGFTNFNVLMPVLVNGVSIGVIEAELQSITGTELLAIRFLPKPRSKPAQFTWIWPR